DDVDGAGDDDPAGDREAASGQQEGDPRGDGHRDDEDDGPDPAGLPPAGERVLPLRRPAPARVRLRIGRVPPVCLLRGLRHQLAPENSLWRLTIQRAIMFTTRVMMKSMRPAAMSSDCRIPNASGKFSAISEGIVWLPEEMRLRVNTPPDRTRVTAIVSPSARPRPSMTEEMMPARAKGKTVILIISHWVAPSARAASSCSLGVCRKISRQSAVMIGRIMTASTTPDVSRV